MVVYRKPTLNCITDLVRCKLLENEFHFEAERKFKWTGNRWTRVIDQPWTGTRAWAAWVRVGRFTDTMTLMLTQWQDRIPEDTDNIPNTPFPLIAYSDKAALSSFGTVKGYPFIVRLLNLHSDIRNGTGIGGGLIVGFIPIVRASACRFDRFSIGSS